MLLTSTSNSPAVTESASIERRRESGKASFGERRWSQSYATFAHGAPYFECLASTYPFSWLGLDLPRRAKASGG